VLKEKRLMKKVKEHLPEIPENVLKTGKKAGKRAGKVAGEFKEFISRGNVTDMAVGIIVGSAFTAIARSFADDVLMPLLGIFMGGIDLTLMSFTFKSFIFPDFGVTIKYGNFLQSIVGFFIVAISVFFMIKALNIVRRKKDFADEPEESAQLVLLTEIRDLLRRQNGEAPPPDENEADGNPPTTDSDLSKNKSHD